MLFNEGTELLNIVILRQGVDEHLLLVQPQVQVVVLVQHVGDAAGHARREVLARGAQNDHPAAGHVLAAVVAHALHHGHRAGVADAEPLTGHAVDVGTAAGGAVQGHVAHDDVLTGFELGALGGIEDQLAAGEALA